MHQFMKMAGCKTPEEFYKKYPSDKAFFKDFPYMKPNGQVNVEQNQSLPSDRSVKNSLRNVQEFNMGGPIKNTVKIQPSTYYTDVPNIIKKRDRYANGGNVGLYDTYDQYIQNEWPSIYKESHPEFDIASARRRTLPANDVMDFQPEAQSYSPYTMSGANMFSTAPQQNQQRQQQSNWYDESAGATDYSIDSVRQAKYGGGADGQEFGGGMFADFKRGGGYWKKQMGGMAQLEPNQPSMFQPDTAYQAQVNTEQQQQMQQIYQTPQQMVNPDPYAQQRAAKYTNDIPSVTPDSIGPQAPTTSSYIQSTTPKQKKKMNPWALGASIASGAVGAIAGAAALKSNLDSQSNFAQFRRSQGETRNMYAPKNPTAYQGQYGQVGQAYGMPMPNNYNPNIPQGNAKYGGYSGTYDGGTGSYYEQGGSYQEGGIYDLTPEEINYLKSKGYKLKMM